MPALPALLDDEVLLPVTRRQVEPGETLAIDDVYWVRQESIYVPPEALTGFANVVGRRVTATLLPREFIRSERLEPGSTPPPTEGVAFPVATYRPLERVPKGECLGPPSCMLVLVAATPLPAGSVIEPSVLVALAKHISSVPDGVALAPDQVIGRTVCSDILNNELIHLDRLGPDGAACHR